MPTSRPPTPTPGSTKPPTTIALKAPGDFSLPRDVCSYGYFLLAPNFWDVAAQTLSRAIDLEDGPTLVTISQSQSGKLRASFSRPLRRSEQAQAKRLLARMLGLNVSEEAVRAFHAVDPRWAEGTGQGTAAGRGRLFRSPTLWEDVLKTVSSCNITWTGTIAMNHNFCRVLGKRVPHVRPAAYTFPSPAKVARARAGTLRGRCRVGYREGRIQQLAKLFAKGEIPEAWLEDQATPDTEVEKFLLGLPGIGPYAAANIMQLLGRYSRLALDTESVRHGKAVLGMEGETKDILKRLEAHYEPFGKYRFLSYWNELWAFYESRRGPAHTWDRETTGRTFTAALLT